MMKQKMRSLFVRLTVLFMLLVLWAVLLVWFRQSRPGTDLMPLCAALVLWAMLLIWKVLVPIFCAERYLQNGMQAGYEGVLSSFSLGVDICALEAQIEQQYQNELLGKQAELSALQSQINPHFLYNTIDSIRGKALSSGADDIADMLEALSTFFRYSISNRGAMVSLEAELENAQNYLKIQQFRFGGRVSMQILPTDRTDLEQCHLPKLTLQPILENAILHGMDDKTGMGHITVKIEGSEHLVRITVSDNGTGMSAQALQTLKQRLCDDAVHAVRTTDSGRSIGVAMPNIARRIRLHFGEQYGMQVMSTPGMGTDVILTLPRQKEHV